MPSEDSKVYLDHLIQRENLRYQRSRERAASVSSGPPMLRMSDLFGDHISSRVASLRKPDFQRATWAWTPDDCVSLLESMINEQVIPSIIMWSSPENGYDYVLDGGHRISVVLAWLNDDWGDKLPVEEYSDETQEILVKQAAREVRNLVKIKIGSISDYQGLLELLVNHDGDIESATFATDYSSLTKRLTNKASKVRIPTGKSRIFTINQKSSLVLDNFFYNPNRCGICGGILDPTADLQHDHIVEHAKGGKTLKDNQRLVHPFCNNSTNREIIENGRNGKGTVKLPSFIDPDLAIGTPQLKLAFFDDPDFR